MLYMQQAHKTGPTIFAWYSQKYMKYVKLSQQSFATLDSTNDTIRRCEKSWIYSYV